MFDAKKSWERALDPLDLKGGLAHVRDPFSPEASGYKAGFLANADAVSAIFKRRAIDQEQSLQALLHSIANSPEAEKLRRAEEDRKRMSKMFSRRSLEER